MISFIDALKTKNIKALEKFPKSDNHNHGTRGGNIRDFVDDISFLDKRSFNNLDEMQMWYEKNIKHLFHGKKGFIQRIESAFRQALNDGVVNLTLSFGTGDKELFNGSYSDLIKQINLIHNSIAPGILFTPEISFFREMGLDQVTREFDELIEHNYFKSIDLIGNDKNPVDNFKGIYIKARDKGFILRAHLGEFGGPDSVITGIKVLELDEIHHGINSVHSKKAMDLIKDRSIRLNICPSSNVMLKRTSSYSTHPIKRLYHEGIKVSINTDDMLIFDQSISQEYLNLYSSEALTAEELDKIRIESL